MKQHTLSTVRWLTVSSAVLAAALAPAANAGTINNGGDCSFPYTQIAVACILPVDASRVPAVVKRPHSKKAHSSNKGHSSNKAHSHGAPVRVLP
jgi:hypothetical protein